MKKVLLTLFVALVCQLAWCQTSDAVIANHKADKNGQYLQMTKAMIQAALAFLPNINDEMKKTKEVLKNVDEINTVIYQKIDNASESGIKEELSKLEAHGYKSLGEASQDDAQGVSYAIIKDDAITDLIVYAKNNDVASLMQVKGRITADQISTVEKFGKK